jgi:hypothetical protein
VAGQHALQAVAALEVVVEQDAEHGENQDAEPGTEMGTVRSGHGNPGIQQRRDLGVRVRQDTVMPP